MTLADRWARTLAEVDRQGRRRTLSPPAGVDFTSNDYLGYCGGRRLGFSGAPAETLPRSGTASRLLRGHHPVWEEVEAALAEWHGAEAALTFSSGYVANEGLLSTVIEPHDWVASDEYNHASVIDGLRLAKAERFVYRHNDLGHLEVGLKAAHQKRTPARQLFVVTESLFSMEGDTAPLRDLAVLAGRYDAHLIVDEAHATGCLGRSGSGLVDFAGLRGRVLATVHTGGKALALTGAYVCGSRVLKDLLVNRCRHFIFTTALPPLVGAWWRERLPFVRGDSDGRIRLHANAELFSLRLQHLGVEIAARSYIVPVVVGDDRTAVTAALRLQQAGFDVRAVRPPTVPPGTARLRLSVHADHTPELLTRAADAVAEVVRTLRPATP